MSKMLVNVCILLAQYGKLSIFISGPNSAKYEQCYLICKMSKVIDHVQDLFVHVHIVIHKANG